MNDNPKISIITIAYNNASDIEPTLKSVSGQTYENIEYIVVDGASTDGTLAIIDRYRDSINVFISEPDEGMYDAINKGIKRATGDVVGLIHAGDRLHDSRVIETVSSAFRDGNVDAIYGYSRLVDSHNRCRTVNISPSFSKLWIRLGWMPSHQSIYVRRSFFEQRGYYRNDLGGSGDYEWFLRFFFFNTLRVKRLRAFLIRFSLGGRSTRSLLVKLSSQKVHRQCWIDNGASPPPLLVPCKLLRGAFQRSIGLLCQSNLIFRE